MNRRQRMSAQDALWLEMDRPTNLMVIDSVVWTEEPIDWDRFTAVAKERLWERYGVFRSVAVRDTDGWYWEERTANPFESHFTHVHLGERGGDAELQEFVAMQRTVPLDDSIPRWKVFCIDGFKGGSAVLTRSHHALADGIRMVQIAMSLFDAAPEGGAILAPAARPGRTPAEGARRSLPKRVRDDVTGIVNEVADLAIDVGGAVSYALTDPVDVARSGIGAVGDAAGAAGKAAGRAAEIAAKSVAHPVGAATDAADTTADVTEAIGSWLLSRTLPHGERPIANLLSSSPGDIDFARKLLLGTRNEPTYWTGPVGTRKAVSWSDPLPLAEIREVARRHGATINDVLATCVAGSLHEYLEVRDTTCTSVNWMIPVNLKPLDLTLPEELGNDFAVVQLEMPTDTPDLLAVLEVVKHRMDRIKHGHEAGLAFRLQELISGFSDVLYRATVDLLANRAVGVLTNVPGPPIPVFIAGTRVTGMVGWAPLSGNQPMSFTIYSYDGKVFVGIACDAELVPDHDQIVAGFGDAFRRLSAAG